MMKFCPFCGELLPTPEAKFCPECGERLVLPVTPAQPQPTQPQPLEQIPKDETKRPTPEELWQQAISEDEEMMHQPLQPEPAQQRASVQKVQVNVALDEESSFTEVEKDDLYPDDDYAPEVEHEFIDENFEDELDEYAQQEQPIQNQGNQFFSSSKPSKIKKHSSGISKVWLIILFVIIILAGVAGFAGLKIKAKNAPEKAVNTFVDAVSSGDTKYVLANIETSGSGLTSADDAKKMLSSMAENLDMKKLKGHLLASQGDWVGGNDEKYNCFSLKQTKDSLFSQKFIVKISPVQLTVQTDIKDLTLYVDDKKVDAQPTDGGVVLKLAPGSHKIRATYQKYGPEYELGKTEITSFSTTENPTVSMTKNLATAEIELAGIETGLQILVNGSKTDIKPDDGFVVINPAFTGMKITVKCDQYSQDFDLAADDQTYSVDYIKELETKYPNAENPSEMTNRQLIVSLAPRFYAFYQSYLEAINRWDKKLIKNVSEAYYADLVTKMEAYNQGLLFDFHGLTFDRRSISRTIKEGELYVTFDVQADFNYAEKTDSGKWFAGGNFQTVTMHYNASSQNWEVSGTVIKDKISFSSDTFTIKP